MSSGAGSMGRPLAVDRTAWGWWGLLALGLALTLGAAVLIVRELAAGGEPRAAEAAEGEASGGARRGDDGVLSLAELAPALDALEPAMRERVLSDAQAFARFVAGERTRRAVLAAAREAGLAATASAREQMRRRAEEWLIERYLAGQSPPPAPDYPSEAEMRAFYVANGEHFQLAERVPAWQIFLPFHTDVDEAAVEAEARALAARLARAEIGFAAAALRHSAHAASRYQGGYLGIVAIAELKPEVRDPLLALAPGELSEPIRGAEGFHLVRRGELLAGGRLPFEAVREEVRALMRQQAALAARRDLLERLAGEHAAVPAATLDEWRARLRAPAR